MSFLPTCWSVRVCLQIPRSDKATADGDLAYRCRRDWVTLPGATLLKCRPQQAVHLRLPQDFRRIWNTRSHTTQQSSQMFFQYCCLFCTSVVTVRSQCRISDLRSEVRLRDQFLTTTALTRVHLCECCLYHIPRLANAMSVILPQASNWSSTKNVVKLDSLPFDSDITPILTICSFPNLWNVGRLPSSGNAVALADWSASKVAMLTFTGQSSQYLSGVLKPNLPAGTSMTLYGALCTVECINTNSTSRT